MAKKKFLKAAVTVSVFISAQAHAATELEWWYSMWGQLGEKVEVLANNFNKSQDDYVIRPVFKGGYASTLPEAIEAFRSNQQPHLLQVYEIGTATMMAQEQMFYPVYELMAKSQEPFDPSAYLPAITSYYSSSEGNMLSMPFNSSTPVMFYNRDAFKKAGLDANKPPRTWQEMEDLSKKLLASGQQCGFTTGYQSMIQVENFAAIHNLPFATHNNGFESTKAELQINQPEFVWHIGKMREWSEAGIFRYGGRGSNSAQLFYNGDCAIYMNTSISQL